MKYLVSKFMCVLHAGSNTYIEPNVKYQIEDEDGSVLVSGFNNEIPFFLDVRAEQKNALKIKYIQDEYIFLFCENFYKTFCGNIMFDKTNICISLSSHLIISINGKVELDEVVQVLEYSFYEKIGTMCVIYFKGIRNYIVIIEDEKVKVASYYDECNISEEEKYFMCRCGDFLNHGKVYHIANKKIENYLVYLDECELNLQEEFVPMVFLDCVIVENLKYCNALLCKELKQKEEQNIKLFFPQFDYYYPIDNETFILINKNTLAGIYKFEVKNCLIENIISL